MHRSVYNPYRSRLFFFDILLIGSFLNYNRVSLVVLNYEVLMTLQTKTFQGSP